MKREARKPTAQIDAEATELANAIYDLTIAYDLTERQDELVKALKNSIKKILLK